MEAVKKRKEFICEKCDPPCIIRASEEVEAPKGCPFGRKEAEWRERKDEEKDAPLASEIIMKPLSWRELREKLCVECYREILRSMCLAASVYKNYESVPNELLEDHPELASMKVTKWETLKELNEVMEKEMERWEKEKDEEELWTAIGGLLCYNEWLLKLAFGFLEMDGEDVKWVVEREGE